MSLYLTKLIVDTVTKTAPNVSSEYSLSLVVTLIAIAAAVAATSSLLRLAADYTVHAQAQMVSDYVSDTIHDKVTRLDVAFFEDPKYYDILHRTRREAPHRPALIVHNMLQIAGNTASLVAIAGLLIWFHWAIALLLLLASFPGFVVRISNSREVYHWQRRRTKTDRSAEYYGDILTSNHHAKELRVFDLGDLFRERYRLLRRNMRKERLEIQKRRGKAEIVSDASAIIALYGSIVYMAYSTMESLITVGDFVMYIQVFQRGQSLLIQWFNSATELYEHTLFLQSYHELLALENRLREPTNSEKIKPINHTGLSVENLSFRYPSAKEEVLRAINLSVRPSEFVAIVGHNGSGKSTLAKLLLRLYDPINGSIVFDGVDIRNFEIGFWRRQVTVLMQDFVRYEVSAGENIWFGDASAPPDLQRIDKASSEADAHSFIDTLPQGLDQVLGWRFENGRELSQGQWQRLALARALYRGSSIIILDEPTSSIDAAGEYQFLTRFKSIIGGRAGIVITHRLSAARLADRIFVMHNGSIVSSGRHDELLKNCTVYRSLFGKQTGWAE